eukprot:gnl/MRDRNA2_/MRDRNA2_78523_c0_seq1.p1 gnl/MRDRNA2_/MRDRNA2_78523_c0~~gnl/MRDRNA2_/MRDRNA2_78523_c0_seq1.p1  ORF type:complete len:117 (-),score=12.31 gnl/MRDRNA2_/MRDRNA2_78523_c0_seq1:97-447(-)
MGFHAKINQLIIRSSTAAEVYGIVQQYQNEFSPFNHVTAMHRIAKMPDANDENAGLLGQILCSLNKALCRKGPWGLLDARQIASIAWALAKLGIEDDTLLASISKAVLRRLHLFVG